MLSWEETSLILSLPGVCDVKVSMYQEKLKPIESVSAEERVSVAGSAGGSTGEESSSHSGDNPVGLTNQPVQEQEYQLMPLQSLEKKLRLTSQKKRNHRSIPGEERSLLHILSASSSKPIFTPLLIWRCRPK